MRAPAVGLADLSSLVRFRSENASALGSVVRVCYNGCVNNPILTRRAALAAVLGGGAVAALAACGDSDSSSSKKKKKKKKK